jgi:hypothetical protein
VVSICTLQFLRLSTSIEALFLHHISVLFFTLPFTHRSEETELAWSRDFVSCTSPLTGIDIAAYLFYRTMQVHTPTTIRA